MLQVALCLMSPVSSMLVAIKYYRNPISHLFMVIFAYYFGARLWMGNDATDHYIEMRLFFCGYSFSDILNNPMVFLHSAEPYTFFLKFLISRFTSSYVVFGGVLCMIYMILQINFFTAFKRYYENGLSLLAGLMMFIVLTVVQFSWYQGVRFWPGVFWFLGFFIRYVHTNKWYHLLLACLCPFIHFSLAILPVALVVNYLLMKCKLRIHIVVFLLSFLVRAAHIDFLPYVLQHVPIFDAFYNTLGVAVVDRNDAITLMEDFRADENLVYSMRSDVIAVGLLLILLRLCLKKVVFSNKYIYFVSMALTLAIIANFEYVDITFYDRFYKLAVLFFAIAVFVVTAENMSILNGRSIDLIAMAFILFAFEVVTHFVELRNAYMHTELWFGNFFMDWHGGLDDYRASLWGDLFN